jgi:tetratricopeptide (TPR) repeat protein
MTRQKGKMKCKMTNRKPLLFFHFSIFYFLFNIHYSFAQQSKIDSLLSVLKKDNLDTNKVNHLNKLSYSYENLGNYDTAFYFANTALELAEKMNFKQGIADAQHNIGSVCDDRGDYAKALEWCFKSLKFNERLKEGFGLANNYTIIGIIYEELGNYSKALEYDLKGLDIWEKSGNQKNIAAVLSNIGVVYFEQKDFPRALDYYFKALNKEEEIGAKALTGFPVGNIALVYAEQAKNKNLTPAQRNDLLEKALEFSFKALKIDEEQGNTNNVARHFGNIGSFYYSLKKNNEAEKYLLQSLKLSDEIGDLYGVLEAELNLNELFLSMKDYKTAYEYFRKASNAKDTIFNIEKTQDITRNEMNYEFEKKEAAVKALHEKEMAIAEAEKKRQRLFLILAGAVAFAITLIAFIIFRALRITRKQKLVIEEQKLIVEKQKELVEVKQKEILDSIHYAKRIQQSLLPTEKYIERNLKRLKKEL